ncbi:Na+/H+ antiporter subunit E [Metabacillus sp. GX 13764]|uniref:Na+/H+ antiporter subunit E n=1 Tax=Metabacillus kandeliae TaxID=2900151 RepID=UPI001E5914A5|nr:Na+/H+ antiporter subunit E [Metabacillus kandeliae]MCD7035735.1 Na+/H+ antiporter subunit E [Metabacillus kandeliae]
MAIQILLNFLIACIWMFLQSDTSTAAFLTGYFLGLLIIFAMRRAFSRRYYVYNIFAAFSLLAIFIKELLLANLSVLKVVLAPKIKASPGIFAYETNLEKPWEITVLSNLITLTPGTLVVEVSDDNKILYIHAMDMDDADKAREDIRNSFEKAIMEVSR